MLSNNRLRTVGTFRSQAQRKTIQKKKKQKKKKKKNNSNAVVLDCFPLPPPLPLFLSFSFLIPFSLRCGWLPNPASLPLFGWILRKMSSLSLFVFPLSFPISPMELPSSSYFVQQKSLGESQNRLLKNFVGTIQNLSSTRFLSVPFPFPFPFPFSSSCLSPFSSVFVSAA